MGTTLSGTTPQSTYPALIKVGDNSALSATLKTLSDGAGNDLPMQVSTSIVNFTGNVGVVTTTPNTNFDVNGQINAATRLSIAGASWSGGTNLGGISIYPSSIGGFATATYNYASGAGFAHCFVTGAGNRLFINDAGVGVNSINPTAKLQVVGSGSTSATTSLLVQNSSGNNALQVKDDLNAVFGQDLQIKGQIAYGGLTIGDSSYYGAKYINLLSSLPGAGTRGGLQWGGGGLCEIVSDRKQPFSQDVTMCFRVKGTEYITIQEVNAASVGTYNVGINNTNPDVSAILDVASTNKGFLPPRMTTSQKNAIATPAIGLMVFDTTLGRPCFYNGAWVTL